LSQLTKRFFLSYFAGAFLFAILISLISVFPSFHLGLNFFLFLGCTALTLWLIGFHNRFIGNSRNANHLLAFCCLLFGSPSPLFIVPSLYFLLLPWEGAGHFSIAIGPPALNADFPHLYSFFRFFFLFSRTVGPDNPAPLSMFLFFQSRKMTLPRDDEYCPFHFLCFCRNFPTVPPQRFFSISENIGHSLVRYFSSLSLSWSGSRPGNNNGSWRGPYSR